MARGQAELFGYLERYVVRQRARGATLTAVPVSRREWESMGCPEVACGVRVVPYDPAAVWQPRKAAAS